MKSMNEYFNKMEFCHLVQMDKFEGVIFKYYSDKNEYDLYFLALEINAHNSSSIKLLIKSGDNGLIVRKGWISHEEIAGYFDETENNECGKDDADAFVDTVLDILNENLAAEQTAEIITLENKLIKLSLGGFCSYNWSYANLINHITIWKQLYLKYSDDGESVEEITINFTTFNVCFKEDVACIGLPGAVLRFRNLRSLIVKGVSFFKLTYEIGVLENLETLILEDSMLQSIPPGIGKLKNLKKLKLDLALANEIPDTLFELENLESLEICAISYIDIPELIGKLKNLKTLKLNGLQVSKVPKSIANLTKLETLDLSFNNLYKLPKSIINLVRLKNLDLSNNNFDFVPESVIEMENLETLNLSANLKLQKLPERIFHLSKLKYINFEKTKLDRIGLRKEAIKYQINIMSPYDLDILIIEREKSLTENMRSIFEIN